MERENFENSGRTCSVKPRGACMFCGGSDEDNGCRKSRDKVNIWLSLNGNGYGKSRRAVGLHWLAARAAGCVATSAFVVLTTLTCWCQTVGLDAALTILCKRLRRQE